MIRQASNYDKTFFRFPICPSASIPLSKMHLPIGITENSPPILKQMWDLSIEQQTPRNFSENVGWKRDFEEVTSVWMEENNLTSLPIIGKQMRVVQNVVWLKYRTVFGVADPGVRLVKRIDFGYPVIIGKGRIGNNFILEERKRKAICELTCFG